MSESPCAWARVCVHACLHGSLSPSGHVHESLCESSSEGVCVRVLPGCVCTGTGGCCSHSPWLPTPSPSSLSPRPFCPPPSPVNSLSAPIFLSCSQEGAGSRASASPRSPASLGSMQMSPQCPDLYTQLPPGAPLQPRPAFRVTLSSSPSLVSEPSFSQLNLHLLKATRHVWSFLQVPREFQGSVRLDQGLERRQDVLVYVCVPEPAQ